MRKKDKIRTGKKPFSFVEAMNVTRAITSDKIKLLFWSGCCFGLRIGDLVRLTKYELMQDYILVKTEKRNKTIRVHIPPIYKKFLRQLDIDIESFPEYPFKTKYGNFLSQSYVAKRIKKFALEIGIPKYMIISYSTHSMRKTFGREYIRSNQDDPLAMYTLSMILGHESESYTRRYLGIEEENIVQNLKNFGKI